MGRRRSVHTDLPPRMQKKGGNFYYVASHGIRRYWIPLGGSEHTARLRWERLHSDDELLKARVARLRKRLAYKESRSVVAAARKTQTDRRAPGVSAADHVVSQARVHAAYTSLKGQAKSRKLAFDLTEQQLADAFEQSGGKCSVSGIPFAFGSRGIGRKRPWAPSIDRIDSRKGYTRDNIRIVCVAVNYALNEFGIEALERIAIAVSLRRREAFHEALDAELKRVCRSPADSKGEKAETLYLESLT